MSEPYDSRDATHSTTSQMLFGLLFGNVIAVLCVVAFRPYPGPGGLDRESTLVFSVLVASIIAVSLLFLVSTVRRRAGAWWIAALALNLTQVLRLIPAAAAIAVSSEKGQLAEALWAFLFVPFLALLAAVGIVMTVRQVRRARRRRLPYAA